jgi:hypothetical protein
LRAKGLEESCAICASRPLAEKFNRSTELQALGTVRMVWWGFSGVKDARRASPIAEARSLGGLLAGVQAEDCKRKLNESIRRAFREQEESRWIAIRQQMEN